jgi:hypothetical protein
MSGGIVTEFQNGVMATPEDTPPTGTVAINVLLAVSITETVLEPAFVT